MSLWCIKGGSSGEREKRMLDNSVLGIGWNRLEDLSRIKDKKDLETIYKDVYPEAGKGRIRNHIGQLYAFVKTIKVGDLVVVPLKTQSTIAVGRVKSDYQYKTDFGEDMKHIRDVEWVKEDLPRTAFEQDLLYSFGAFMTVCKVKRNNAEERVKAIIEGKKIQVKAEADTEADEEQETKDIEIVARDQIREYINRNFKGHDLTRLVDGVLQAQGLITERSDPGPDGGVDILAGGGSMGFDEPHLCVQVKSSDSPIEAAVLRELKGTMQTLKAKHGLLVSWGGFKRTVKAESKGDYFSIKLWDSDDLITAIEKYYDKLPDAIQAELPLKRIWTLSLEDEE